MRTLLRLSDFIDGTATWIGRSVAWLVMVAVLVSAGNAVARKVAGVSSNAWLELQWYLFGAVFMLGASWVLAQNQHVRIDVVTAILSQRTRHKIDLFGHVFFLMPFAALMAWLSWPFFINSFKSGEVSMNAGGLIVWPAKFLVLAGFVLFVAQGLSEIIKTVALLRGDIADASAAAVGSGGAPPVESTELNAGGNPDDASTMERKDA